MGRAALAIVLVIATLLSGCNGIPRGGDDTSVPGPTSLATATTSANPTTTTPPPPTSAHPPCPSDPGARVTHIAVATKQSQEDADLRHEGNLTITGLDEQGQETWFCGFVKVALESRSGDVPNYQYAPVGSWTAEVDRSSFKDPRMRSLAPYEPPLNRFYFIIDDHFLENRTHYRVNVDADVYASGKSFSTSASLYYQL